MDRVERDDIGAVDVRIQIVAVAACMAVSMVVGVCVIAAVMTVVIIVRHD